MRPGEVIGEAWALYRAHWRHLVPIALVVYLLLSLFVFLLVALFGWLGYVSSIFVLLAGLFWVQGALVIAVEDIRDGRADLSIRETLTRVRPRMNTLGMAGILAAFGIVLGLVLFVVPGLVLATWWLLIVPAIVLEGRGVFAAFGRSRELARGDGWNVFGLLAVTIVILVAAGIVLQLALTPLDFELRQYVGDVVRNTLFAPFVALAFTLAYYRLRERRDPSATAVVTGV